jgi:hypothetical protein
MKYFIVFLGFTLILILLKLFILDSCRTETAYEICDPNFEADEENGYCYLSIEKTDQIHY